ncbi:MAG: DNA polymerase III subunit delta [Lachnospiraceae bacterium]|nr:DNA polymerase III subunit delta [Lachnospiraceae bacterium]
MENVKKHIKEQQFNNIYLICGEEEYLKRNIKKNLSEAIVSADDNMNRSYYEGKNINFKEVIDLCETMPFFSDRRLVLFENTGCFEKACDELLEYLPELTTSTYLVFVEEKVDKRSKLFKLVKSNGYVCECNHLNNDSLMKWILTRIGKENKKITRDTMNYIINSLGNDLEKISCEIEKLLCYTLNKDVIEIADVDAVCIPEITGKIFEMIDAMGNKNKEKALELYYDLLSQKEPPMRILFMLSRQFNIMLQVKELSDKRMSKKEIEEKLNMKGFVISKIQGQLKNFTHKSIREALEKAIELEEAIKNGNMNEKVAVELLLTEFSC